MAIVGALEIAGGDRIGKDEERCRIAAILFQAFDIECMFVIEHVFQALPANIAIALAIDGIADRHVVSRHALGDRASRAADAKEPAHDSCPAPISAKEP